MIHIVDYGLGNVQAFVNLYKRMGIDTVRATNARQLTGACKLLLPGVGAFDHAMESLDASGMRPTITELVQRDSVPVLGVCVGMQMLSEGSDEGSLEGLGWIPGRVRHLGSHSSSAPLPMPHMGWNDVQPVITHPVFAGLEADARFYFLHSYYFECAEPADAAAKAAYGLDFTCAVRRGNVIGVQFHPEKSHRWGMALLRNFAKF